jgi:hypothetical protein
MSPRSDAARKSSDFVRLLHEFLAAHRELGAALSCGDAAGLSFASIADVVGDDERSVLYRLKRDSHDLFRSEGLASAAVRREVLFDLAVGSLFHEAMKLRESLYQREVYAPRLASLREAAEGESDPLLEEFERLGGNREGRLEEILAEVRILLIQTRDQFRRLLVERAGERPVTRALVGRRKHVDAAFSEGFAGLMEAMHGDVATGLVDAAHSLLDSAYFTEASQVLREAARKSYAHRGEIDQLQHYSEGMQLYLAGDYVGSVQAIEAWIDLGGPDAEREFGRRAASALGRVGRLVGDDSRGAAILDAAKQLQLRLETASG